MLWVHWHHIFRQSRQVNDKNRLNPDNKIQDLESSKRMIELDLGISDSIDHQESIRWLFKGYGFSQYEKGATRDLSSDRLIINELFLDWTTDNWFVSLGKRRNSWGPALAFNPVNVIVPARDPLDPDNQAEGHPMLWVNYADDTFTLDLIFTRDYDRNGYGKYQRWGGRLNALLGEWDIGAYYYDGEKNEDNVKYNTMIGFSLSGNFLSNATLYVETAVFAENRRNYYSTSNQTFRKNETVVKTAAGSMITLDGNTSVTLEIYQNNAGYSPDERENYFKAVDSALTSFPDTTEFGIFNDFQFSEMNPRYLLLTFRKTEIWEKYSYSIQGMMAEDSSVTTEIEGVANLSDFYKLTALFQQYVGDDNSEFGNNPVLSQFKLILSASF